jgi:hypothetical protein
MPVSAQTLGLLLDAGLSSDQLRAVVASIDADMAPTGGGESRSARQERNARYYAAKRLKPSETVLQRLDSDASETVLKPSETVLNKTPLAHVRDNNPNTKISGKKESTEVAVAPAERATRPSKRCPADWEPKPETTVTLVGEGHSPDRMRAEIRKFRDYTFAAAKTDWDATWRNWVRNAAPGGRTDRPKNWRELESENNEASYRGALGALEIMKEKDRLSERRGQDQIIDGSCTALSQIEPNREGASALVVRLSDRLTAPFTRSG